MTVLASFIFSYLNEYSQIVTTLLLFCASTAKELGS